MPLDLQMKEGCIIGRDDPQPIVDHRAAYRSAKDKIFVIRTSDSAVAEANQVFIKHGSRKRRDPITKAKKAKQPLSTQMTLFNEDD